MPASLILGALFEGGMVGAAAFFGATGLAVATFAVNFAVSMIVSRVFSSSAGNQNTNNGVRQQVPPSNTNSIPIVYGDAYLGGVFVDAVLSIDQKTMYYVLAVSQISPNGQFSFDTTKMYWQDQIIGFDGTDHTKVITLTDNAYPTPNVKTNIAGNLYINLYKSDESGTITCLNGTNLPNVVMGGSDIASAQRWPSHSRQMNGLAFAIVKLNYNQTAGTTAMQPVTFHASHYLNSTGVAKPGDVWYDYITNVKYGCAMDSSIVDSASATALNTYSDQTISYYDSNGNPATQARYRINGVLDTGQDVLSNLDQIMLACDSWNQYNAASGKWSVVINQPRSTDFAFDDSNIVGQITVSAFDISQSINQIQAQFPNKLNRDQADYVYLNTPTGLLFTNEPNNKYTLTYQLVNDSVQVQYLANRLLEQAREDLIVTFATTYNGIQVDAGDVISVTNAAYGWTNKLFRVIKVSETSLPDGNLGAALELNEYNPDVYLDGGFNSFSPSPNSNLSNPNYFSNLTAPTVVNINTIATVPHFDVVCNIPATGRVTKVTLFYTTVASPATTDWKLWGVQSATNAQPFQPSSSLTFADITLPVNTYYFGYLVENESGASSLSPISSSLNWSPNLITTVGSSPAISGNTMTGAGSTIVSSGNFAFGNATTNISFDGTTMTLNGNVVATGNINLNAVSVLVNPSLGSDQTFPQSVSFPSTYNGFSYTGGTTVTVNYDFLTASVPNLTSGIIYTTFFITAISNYINGSGLPITGYTSTSVFSLIVNGSEVATYTVFSSSTLTTYTYVVSTNSGISNPCVISLRLKTVSVTVFTASAGTVSGYITTPTSAPSSTTNGTQILIQGFKR